MAIEAGVDLRLEILFAAGHRHRRLHDAVGKLHQTERLAANAHVAFDSLVVRDHLLVGHGPVVSVAVMAGGGEVELGQTVALTRPGQRAPSELAAAGPLERLVLGIRVWISDVIYEPLEVRFPACVLHALDRAVAADFWGSATVLQVERAQVLGELGLGRAMPRFEQRDAHARLGQGLGDPAPGRPGTDNDRVVGVVVLGDDLHERWGGCGQPNLA